MQFEIELEINDTNEKHILSNRFCNEREVKLCLTKTKSQLGNTSVTEFVTLSTTFHL